MTRFTPPAPRARPFDITVAHDYFTQFGGAERVAVALIEGLRPSRIVTSLHEPEHTFAIPGDAPVETSFLQRTPAFRQDPRKALPLLPFAWRRFRPVSSGVVVCSSSGWSHGMPTARGVVKIVYCHNPARWLYQPADYFRDRSSALRALAAVLRPPLEWWDRIAARSADVYIANSRSVADRIRDVYGIEAHILHPPVSIDPSARKEAVPGVGPRGFFLTVGRGRGYKNLDLLTEAFAETPDARLVAVGADITDVPPNVTVLPRVSDAQMRWLYANSTALLSMSHEDFGLTPIEANAFGTPVLVLRAGGFLDSVREGVTGMYVDEETSEAVAAAVQSFPQQWDRAAIREHAAGFAPAVFLDRLTSVIEQAVERRAGRRRPSRRSREDAA